MDQDFHYYGTYYAAKTGGFNKDDATLIAKAANFIDFLNEDYPSSWVLVGGAVNHTINPRYTFQGSIFQQLLSPQDSVWCAYHFTPGNYNDPPNTPSREAVHGQDVATYLPAFQIRDTNGGREILGNVLYYPITSSRYLADLAFGQMLNRPQSALSRQLIMDTIRCATDDARLKSILGYAAGGQDILQNADNLRRFKLILLGVRAHVIADTWAHQDFCGLNNVLNTYWDVNYTGGFFGGWGEQSINYNDGTTSSSSWKNKTISSTYGTSSNFVAAPNGTSYLGHGWMGHLPDFSFVKFRYKPCWADPSKGAIERNNPQEYQPAWVELVSLFTQAKGSGQLKLTEQFQSDLNKAVQAMQSPCNLEGNVTGRKSSANAWQNIFGDLPSINIDVDPEPDANSVLDGMSKGTNNVNINSDLYLFQIAADYHFHFVKYYLERHGIYRFTGSWSQQTSALSPDVSNLFVEQTKAPVVVYATYNGSQLGVTVRDLKLNQLSCFNTGINARAIAAGPNNDVYLASGNCLYNFTAEGVLITVMTFPISTINYTSLAVHGDKVYASYTGSQQGVTVRDLKLNQISYFNTGVDASGIAAGTNNDLYLAAGNRLIQYATNGTLITDMTFPDASITYTDVAVKGDNVFASYTGSQKGVTVRDLKLNQISWFNTNINASSITVGASNDVYLAEGNHLYNYDINGALIIDMTFPIPSVNYTGISF
ncbi:MAG: DUF6765 family protein [Gallionella sp.]